MKPYWTVEKVILVGAFLAVLSVGSFATVWYASHQGTSTTSGASTQPSSDRLIMSADFSYNTGTQKISDRYVVFNATVMGNRRLYSLEWQFGNGVTFNQFARGNGTVITHYDYGGLAGTHTVTLTVTPSAPDPSCSGSICPAIVVSKTFGLTPDFVIVIGSATQVSANPILRNAGTLQSITFKGASCYFSDNSFRDTCGQDKYFGWTFTATLLPDNLYSVTLPNGISYNVEETWYNSTTNVETSHQTALNVFTTDYVLNPDPLT